MQADIITIGDEILIGQIVNTNAVWMGAELSKLGFTVRRMLSIPDREADIVATLDDSIQHADLVIITGGLGPTNDDKTKHTLNAYFGGNYVIHEGTMRQLEGFFAARNMAVSERNKKQAEVPDTCEPLLNQHGTAPGMLFRKGHTLIASLPGVPFEMKGIYEDELRSRIVESFQLPIRKHRTLLTIGRSEAATADLLHDWETQLEEGVGLAYLPSPGILRIRISVTGSNEGQVKKLLQKKEQELCTLLETEYVFGSDEDTLESVVGELLKKRKQTLSTAESCTGGNIAHRITSVAGSSAYFQGAVVAYANEIKQQFLGVDKQVIADKGAVSQEVVEQMASGVQKRMQTDYGIATSGIAGPSGGSAEKPVGTVWIAVATPQKVISKRYQLGNKRERCIAVASFTALNMLRNAILVNR